MNREAHCAELGDVDREAGEFWVPNPFMMPGQGHNLSAYERNQLFLSDEFQGFINASTGSGVDLDSDSRSAVAADFNRDGATDLLVGNVGGGPLQLFHNAAPLGRWVRLNLVGTDSNRTAIGSRVILRCGSRQIVRDLFAVNGFMGQAPAELLIGVGSAEKLDQLTIRWPTGRTQDFADLPVEQTISIREGAAEFSLGK